MGATGTTAARLEQPLLPLQIAERPNVCQGEGEAILVFVTHRSEREAAVFKADAAAVPVIGGLGGGVLQQIELAVKANVCRGAPAVFCRAAIAKLCAYLIKQGRHAGGLMKNMGSACWQKDPCCRVR